MAISLKEQLRYGNIKKDVKVEILPYIVWCPICGQFTDAYLNNGDEIECDCGCDIDDYIHNDDHNNVVDERDDLLDELDGRDEDIAALQKTIDRLERELFDAKS